MQHGVRSTSRLPHLCSSPAPLQELAYDPDADEALTTASAATGALPTTPPSQAPPASAVPSSSPSAAAAAAAASAAAASGASAPSPEAALRSARALLDQLLRALPPRELRLVMAARSSAGTSGRGGTPQVRVACGINAGAARSHTWTHPDDEYAVFISCNVMCTIRCHGSGICQYRALLTCVTCRQYVLMLFSVAGLQVTLRVLAREFTEALAAHAGTRTGRVTRAEQWAKGLPLTPFTQ